MSRADRDGRPMCAEHRLGMLMWRPCRRAASPALTAAVRRNGPRPTSRLGPAAASPQPIMTLTSDFTQAPGLDFGPGVGTEPLMRARLTKTSAQTAVAAAIVPLVMVTLGLAFTSD